MTCSNTTVFCYSHTTKNTQKNPTKIVHFIRHGEGEHNVAATEIGRDAYQLEKFFDTKLTQNGRKQAIDLRSKLTHLGIEMVVVSPFTRTLETAKLVFLNDSNSHELSANETISNSPSSNGEIKTTSAPLVALEHIREHCGTYPCDQRQPIRVYQKQYPMVDFSLCSSDEDTMWTEVRESEEEMAARARKFLSWLEKRKEQTIAVVSHSGFLRVLFTVFHYLTDDKSKLSSPFANCELRSVRLAFDLYHAKMSTIHAIL